MNRLDGAKFWRKYMEKGEENMRAVAQNKLAKKLLLLFVLTGALIYLRNPDRGLAYGCPCQVGCGKQLAMCDNQCNGNTQCQNDCYAQYLQCQNQCQISHACCPNGCN